MEWGVTKLVIFCERKCMTTWKKKIYNYLCDLKFFFYNQYLAFTDKFIYSTYE